MTTPTTHYGFTKPIVGGSPDTWGTENNNAWDQVDSALYAVSLVANSAVATSAPTGMIAAFDLAAAPAGWIALNGGTVGNAASGGTTRANADTAAYFAAMWAFNNTLRPIQDSTGTPTTRGASAAADFAANKRITISNPTNRVLRGIGADAPALGDVQADSLKDHTHDVAIPLGSSFNGNFIQPTTTSLSSNKTITSTSPSTGAAAETRGKGYGVLFCGKL